MNPKKLLLCAVFIFLSASLAQAGQEANSPPSFFQFPSAVQTPAPQQPALDCDSSYPLGDANLNRTIELADATTLLNCIFVNAGPSCLPCTVDVNCDTNFSAVDLILFLNFYFGPYSEFPTLAKLKCPSS